jgi:hypothetical protein
MGATVAFRDEWRDARRSRYREYRPAEQQCQAREKPRPFGFAQNAALAALGSSAS